MKSRSGARKVFISFDFDHDKALKNLLLAQTRRRTAPFRVIDKSLHEESPNPRWHKEAASHIKSSDMVFVVLGPETHKSKGVLKEVAMARRMKKPVVQIRPHHRSRIKVLPENPVVAWNWKNLKAVLSAQPRTAADKEVRPAHNGRNGKSRR